MKSAKNLKNFKIVTFLLLEMERMIKSMQF
jgi:hypothetical protein